MIMRLLDRTLTDKEDVRHLTSAELASLGIAILDKQDLLLKCNNCGQTWLPALDANGKLSFNYWLCPRSCNS